MQVVADAAGVNPDAAARLIFEERIAPDAYVRWGFDKDGKARYRPMFLESRVPELAATVKRYTRVYVPSSLKQKVPKPGEVFYDFNK
jgi:hypothetical protein